MVFPSTFAFITIDQIKECWNLTELGIYVGYYVNGNKSYAQKTILDYAKENSSIGITTDDREYLGAVTHSHMQKKLHKGKGFD